MSNRVKEQPSANGIMPAKQQGDFATSEESRVAVIARAGVRTIREAAMFGEAAACDAVLGLISPRVAGVALTGINTYLRAMDLQNRYGKTQGAAGHDVIVSPADEQQKQAVRRAIAAKQAEIAALEQQLTP